MKPQSIPSNHRDRLAAIAKRRKRSSIIAYTIVGLFAVLAFAIFAGIGWGIYELISGIPEFIGHLAARVSNAYHSTRS